MINKHNQIKNLKVMLSDYCSDIWFAAYEIDVDTADKINDILIPAHAEIRKLLTELDAEGGDN